ncbi:MotA/TolQ/ExbB proton channel family protein [Proteinivorax hydrogeniformans]|uniref:MotA/TolQ/ExbB proton channel family protein n=1 Tax=Proteinivorax hydrogeniformans TaxID=1826727 RepID=A0AAU8HPD2_9FIRM
MDLTTIIGIIIGFVLFITAIFLQGSLEAFISIDGILIVLGGTLAATAVSYPLSQLKLIIKTIKIAFTRQSMSSSGVIKLIVSFADKARREGLLSLEDDLNEVDDNFLKKGVQLVVDGTDPELVRNILETELTFLEDRHRAGRGIFETMGTFSPAFGMAGTLVGLISMLERLDNPDAIGPGLATALITTFYGVLLANLVFIPISGKLKVKSEEEIRLKEVVVEGLLSIQAGENPRIVEEKLKAFLAPGERESLNNEGDGAEDDEAA